jgi:hypothetical protein
MENKSMEIYDFKGLEKYDFSISDKKMILITPNGDKYKSGLYNRTLKILGLKPEYEFTKRDINKFVIGRSCDLMFYLDINGNLVIDHFEKSHGVYLYIAITKEGIPYVTQGQELFSSWDITEDMYMNVLDTCIKIFGIDMCLESALTYAREYRIRDEGDSMYNIWFKEDYLSGSKVPEQGLLKGLFLHQQGFKFHKPLNFSLDNKLAEYFKNILTPIWKERWDNLFLSMNPSGQWWISDGMEFDDDSMRWKRYDSSVLFSIVSGILIQPIEDFERKIYLKDL